jgi:lycopene beta-cyclase
MALPRFGPEQTVASAEAADVESRDMARGRKDGVLIAGAGLSGSLAAIAMAKKRPDVPILLVEESESFGAERTSVVFESDIDEADRWLIEPLIAEAWEGFYVSFPGHSRKLKSRCFAIRGADVDRLVRETLRPEQYRTGTKAVAVRGDELVLLGGDRLKAEGAVDARGAANLSLLDLAWQKSFGREYAFSEPHRVDRPVLMDATVEQSDGFRFVRCTPFSDTRLLVEDCSVGEAPEIDAAASGARLDAYVAKRGWKGGEVEHEESSALPVALGGDFSAFWRVGGARVARLGLRGGFFHPTTGQTVADAVRTAILLTQQRSFDGEALHDAFEAEAAALWRKRELQRGFNAALFAADDRRSVYDQYYQLDPALIARFQSGRTGVLDRVRLGKLVK